MAYIGNSLSSPYLATDLFAQLEQYLSLDGPNSIIGLGPLYKKNMKYYQRNLQYGLYDELKNFKYIYEITVPLITSKLDDLKDFCARKGFTIENQVLHLQIPPLVRIIRKISEPTPLLGALAWDKEMQGYVKSLKALTIPASRVYSAVILPSIRTFIEERQMALRYQHGIEYGEITCTIESTNFKEISELYSKELSQRAFTDLYRNESDSEGTCKLLVRVPYNAFQPTHTFDALDVIDKNLAKAAKLQAAPQEHKLVLVNTTLA
jgi:hypothetical protein